MSLCLCVCGFFKGGIPHRGCQQAIENSGNGNKSLLLLTPYQTDQAINPGSCQQGRKVFTISLPDVTNTVQAVPLI